MLAVGLLGLLVLSLLLRPTPSPAIPPRLPKTQVTPWVADCLPGIGPRRRDNAAAALAAGRLGELPAGSRATAAQLIE